MISAITMIAAKTSLQKYAMTVIVWILETFDLFVTGELHYVEISGLARAMLWLYLWVYARNCGARCHQGTGGVCLAALS